MKLSTYRGVDTSDMFKQASHVYFVHSYVDKHQIQLFGRGHIGGIDIKVCFCDCVNDSHMFMLKVPRPKVLWLTKM